MFRSKHSSPNENNRHETKRHVHVPMDPYSGGSELLKEVVRRNDAVRWLRRQLTPVAGLSTMHSSHSNEGGSGEGRITFEQRPDEGTVEETVEATREAAVRIADTLGNKIEPRPVKTKP